MPRYKYTAKTLADVVETGVADSPNVATLAQNLREENKFLLKYKELSSKAEVVYRLNSKELAEFCRELGTMLKSGIMTAKALSIMKNRDISKKLKAVYELLYQYLLSGNTLSVAMKNCGTVFPELLINMFAAGESGSRLVENADKMAVYYEKDYRISNKIKNAATYPLILLAVTFVVIILVFSIILPQFFTLLEGVELPLITKIVMALSHAIVSYWYIILIAILIIIVLLGYILQKPSVRLRLDRLKLYLPLIGKPLKTIYTARFAQSLSSLYSSGLPMLNAVLISANVLNNSYIKLQFEAVAQEIKNGQALSAAISRVNGFDSKLISTITIGEETGRLGVMLAAMGESFEYEGELAINRLITLMEPIMIVVMAIIIGATILSVLLPILTMYQTIA